VRLGHANGLRWCHTQGFVNRAEIVMDNIQRDRRNVIIKFPGEAIGEMRKSALAHAQRKVPPLKLVGRDVLLGIA
jgi:hypothetical protein